MKKINNISFAVILAFIFAGLYSCIGDDYCDCDNNIGTPESLTLSYSLSSSQQLRSTRALPTEPGDHDGSFNENIVNKLDLFFYQAGELKLHVPTNQLIIGDAEPADSIRKKITIPVTGAIKALIDATNPVYDLYVVANNTADLSSITPGTNLTALQNLLFTTAGFASKGGFQPQTSFVMDGKLTGVNIKTTPDMGKAFLKRAASKVRIRILEILDTSGEGYVHDPATMGAPQARLVHFTDQSVLLEGGTAATPAAPAEWKNTEWRNVASPVGGEVGLPGNTTAAPFYAYSNDWNTDVARETYVELKIPFSKNGVTRDYFYHVPVTPYALGGTPNPDVVPHLNKMERDFLYDIAVKINYVGSSDNPPVTLDGNYTISNWGEQNIVASIFMFHYLMVTPNNTVMPNTNTVTLDFLSSVSPVQYKDLSVSYTYVNAAGEETTVPITGGEQYATITINNDTKKITVTSAVPVNYIPKDITFTVYSEPSSSLTLEQQVVIKQLPATYFTTTKGIRSYIDGVWRYSLPGTNTNPYMYAITTLAPDGNIIWGFPPTDAEGRTLNNQEVSNMVSPKFEMASQFGASFPKTYSNAQKQCREYIEVYKDENGNEIQKTGWRLPTAAEIRYIDNLQQTAPTGYVMEGRYYWSSWSQYPTQRLRSSWSGYYFTDAVGAYRMGRGIFDDANDFVNHYSGSATYEEGHVRCIRDVKN